MLHVVRRAENTDEVRLIRGVLEAGGLGVFISDLLVCVDERDEGRAKELLKEAGLEEPAAADGALESEALAHEAPRYRGTGMMGALRHPKMVKVFQILSTAFLTVSVLTMLEEALKKLF